MQTAQLNLLLACLKAARTAEHQAMVADAIDLLSLEQRVMVRQAAEAAGIESLPRNLFFCYATQRWF